MLRDEKDSGSHITPVEEPLQVRSKKTNPIFNELNSISISLDTLNHDFLSILQRPIFKQAIAIEKIRTDIDSYFEEILKTWDDSKDPKKIKRSNLEKIHQSIIDLLKCAQIDKKYVENLKEVFVTAFYDVWNTKTSVVSSGRNATLMKADTAPSHAKNYKAAIINFLDKLIEFNSESSKQNMSQEMAYDTYVKLTAWSEGNTDKLKEKQSGCLKAANILESTQDMRSNYKKRRARINRKMNAAKKHLCEIETINNDLYKAFDAVSDLTIRHSKERLNLLKRRDELLHQRHLILKRVYDVNLEVSESSKKDLSKLDESITNLHTEIDEYNNSLSSLIEKQNLEKEELKKKIRDELKRIKDELIKLKNEHSEESKKSIPSKEVILNGCNELKIEFSKESKLQSQLTSLEGITIDAFPEIDCDSTKLKEDLNSCKLLLDSIIKGLQSKVLSIENSVKEVGDLSEEPQALLRQREELLQQIEQLESQIKKAESTLESVNKNLESMPRHCVVDPAGPSSPPASSKEIERESAEIVDEPEEETNKQEVTTPSEGVSLKVVQPEPVALPNANDLRVKTTEKIENHLTALDTELKNLTTKIAEFKQAMEGVQGKIKKLKVLAEQFPDGEFAIDVESLVDLSNLNIAIFTKVFHGQQLSDSDLKELQLKYQANPQDMQDLISTSAADSNTLAQLKRKREILSSFNEELKQRNEECATRCKTKTKEVERFTSEQNDGQGRIQVVRNELTSEEIDKLIMGKVDKEEDVKVQKKTYLDELMRLVKRGFLNKKQRDKLMKYLLQEDKHLLKEERHCFRYFRNRSGYSRQTRSMHEATEILIGEYAIVDENRENSVNAYLITLLPHTQDNTIFERHSEIFRKK